MTILANLGQHLLWIICFVIFAYSSLGFGSFLLRLGRITINNSLDRILLSIATSWIVIGYAIYLLGAFHLIWTPLLWLFTASSFLLACRFLPFHQLSVRPLRRWWHQLSVFSRVIVGLLFIIWMITFLGTLVPDTSFDATWYHLPTAQFNLLEHTAHIRFPSLLDRSSVAPRIPDLINTWLLSVDRLNSTLPQMFHWLAGVLLVLATYRLLSRFFSCQASLYTSLLLAISPAVIWLSRIAYVDLYVGFFGAALFLAISIWLDRPSDRRLLWLIGFLLGGLCSSKMQAAVYTLPALLLVWSARRKIADLWPILLITLVMTLSWYIEIWVVTGNPLFALIRPPGDSELAGSSSFRDWVLSGQPHTFLSVIWNTLLYEMPFLFLACLPLVFWRYTQPRLRWFVAAGLLSLLGWTYIPVHEIRYLSPGIPLLVLGLAWLYDKLSTRWRWPLFVLTGTFFLFSFLLLLNLSRHGGRVILGLQSRQEYLASYSSRNKTLYFDINGELRRQVGDSKVLTLIHNPFYVDFAASDEVRFAATPAVSHVKNAQSLINLWHQAGFRYLVAYGQYGLDDFLPFQPSASDSALLYASVRTVDVPNHSPYLKVWELQ